MRRDPFQQDVIAYGELQNAADPAEVARPLRTGNLIDLLPRLFAELSLVPGFECQAREPQVGTGELFRRSQRVHARLVEPRSLVVFRQRIDAKDVVDVVAHQAEGDRESRLPRSDHQHVEDRLAVRGATGHHPWPLREIEQRPVLSRALFQHTQPLRRVAQECGHACGQRAQLARSGVLEHKLLPHTRRAPLPLVGRGWGWGSCDMALKGAERATPLPNPPPQGGRGVDRARCTHKSLTHRKRCYAAFSVVGSIILRTSVILVAGKPLISACLRMMASSLAR